MFTVYPLIIKRQVKKKNNVLVFTLYIYIYILIMINNPFYNKFLYKF